VAGLNSGLCSVRVAAGLTGGSPKTESELFQTDAAKVDDDVDEDDAVADGISDKSSSVNGGCCCCDSIGEDASSCGSITRDSEMH
jgi:hypothetical protein